MAAMPPEFCPHCGAEVPPRATVCPECGSSEETGWSEQAQADYLGLPDESFEYDDFIKREFEDGGQARSKVPWYLWVVVVLLVLALIGWFW